ncbi:hypothetical protein M404DRAFT_19988 [Pisolithus tinctorius Marx 270]|uniref:Uncharacterized protein n=1 Tax=Pisolithus tinctorius Marx 270 TaxID=870435 RepID=A0A0C3PEB1_PISTI|nr:hypothetical protein M404DRAFT_19988 [Pisolithus tinctorius Marx 270]
MSLFDDDNDNDFCLQMETSSNASIKEQLTIRHSEDDGNGMSIANSCTDASYNASSTDQLAARCTTPKPAEHNTTAGVAPKHEPPHASASTTHTVTTTSTHHK